MVLVVLNGKRGSESRTKMGERCIATVNQARHATHIHERISRWVERISYRLAELKQTVIVSEIME